MVDAKIAPKEETKDAGNAEIDKVETKRKKPDKNVTSKAEEKAEWPDDAGSAVSEEPGTKVEPLKATDATSVDWEDEQGA